MTPPLAGRRQLDNESGPLIEARLKMNIPVSPLASNARPASLPGCIALSLKADRHLNLQKSGEKLKKPELLAQACVCACIHGTYR